MRGAGKSVPLFLCCFIHRGATSLFVGVPGTASRNVTRVWLSFGCLPVCMQVLCIQGFLTCRKHAERILLLVEMMQVRVR